MTNDTSPPPSAPPPGPGYTGPPPHPGAAARDGLVRPLHGRYLAGVCAAVARATNTDPVLWRVLAVVLTIFGGIGLLLYLLGLLLIPEEGDTASPIEALAGRGTSTTSPVTVVVVAVLAALVFLFVVADVSRVLVLGVFAVVAALLLLLQRSSTGRQTGPTPPGGPGTPGAPPAPGVGVPGAAPAGPSTQAPPSPMAPPPTGAEQPVAQPGPPAAVTAPMTSRPSAAQQSVTQPTVTQPTVTQPTMTESATQPTGSQPAPAQPTGYPPPPPGGYRPAFAPHGPYASFPPPPTPPTPPAPPRPPREPSRLGALVLSLMCLALGALVVVDLITNTVRASMYVATALAVVGLGLLVGAWLGRARWLIALGVVLTLTLGVVSTTERLNIARHAPVIWHPQVIEDLQTDYELDFGDATLDLRDVDFATEPDPVRVRVKVSFGRLRVLLPPDVDVTVTARVNLGDAHVLGTDWGGIDTPRQQVTDQGADGIGGGTLLIDAEIDAGKMEVTR
ncbi:MAG: PspC domain-containing protein [Micromonosporaceae bacterium]